MGLVKVSDEGGWYLGWGICWLDMGCLKVGLWIVGWRLSGSIGNGEFYELISVIWLGIEVLGANGCWKWDSPISTKLVCQFITFFVPIVALNSIHFLSGLFPYLHPFHSTPSYSISITLPPNSNIVTTTPSLKPPHNLTRPSTPLQHQPDVKSSPYQARRRYVETNHRFKPTIITTTTHPNHIHSNPVQFVLIPSHINPYI